MYFAFFNLTLSWTSVCGQLKELESIVELSQKLEASRKVKSLDLSMRPNYISRMFLLEFLTRSSPYLLNISLLTAPLSAFSIWFYDQKKRPRTISTIYLFGFLFVGISIALMMGINSQYASERGYLGLFVGFTVSVLLFGILLKLWYRLTWPSTILAAWMPISYFSYFFFISNYL